MATLLDMFSFFRSTSKPAALAAPMADVDTGKATRKEQLAYAGAARNRLTYDWRTDRSGPNREVYGGLLTLRDRSRDLVRNNPHARKAIETITANVVGTGIRAKYVNPDDKRLEQTVNDLWKRWQIDASAESDLEWSGLQHLLVSSWLESGEVLLRRRWRRLEDGLAVPFQVEAIEADQLWEQKTTTLANGGVVVQGVEFDPIGRRAGYWLLRTHPGEYASVPSTNATTSDAVRVAVEDVAHLYRPTRPKQARGIPWLHAVMLPLRDLDQYQLSERVRKRAQAGVVGVVIPADDATFDPDTTDAVGLVENQEDGSLVDEMQPGGVFVARGGRDFRFSTPTSDAGYGEWVTTQLRVIAAGCLMTHEQLSGDLSQVNYSSIRLGVLEFHRMVETLRTHNVVPMLCRPVWRWFIEAAIAAGQIPAGEYPPSWVYPHREEIDRKTAVEAAALEIRNGLRSRRDEITARGGDPNEVLSEQVADAQAARAADLWFDSDPNKAQNAGAPTPPEIPA